MAGAVKVTVVELTTDTTLACTPLMITNAPATKPVPVKVIVSPPAVFVAVSSPGYVIEAILGTDAPAPALPT
jgi:hypothetical protein